MKILHIINSLATGGAEKLILETLPLYAAQGIETDLLLLNGTRYPFLKELEEQKCCRIFSLGNSSVYHPKNIFKIMAYLKNYDLVHVHLFPAQYYVVLAKILSGSKTKLIFTEHCTGNRRLDSIWLSIIDKHIYKWYSAIVSITREINDILLKHARLPINRFHLIENGVNLNTITSAMPYPESEINLTLSSADKIIIQIAAFREQKDQETLIKAMSSLPPTFKLVLVGEGVQKEKCVNVATELGIQDRVFFLGVRMDVPQLLKTADIVVLSSKYEGMSLSSIEGMASGKPFIASDVPGLSEIVKGAGVLFPLGDAKKLAAEILHLANDSAYYQKIAGQCFNRAKEFDISKMVDKHIALYQELSQK